MQDCCVLRVLDLYAGGGGLSLGFELAECQKGNYKFEIFRAVDNNKYACETLRNHFLKTSDRENVVIEGNIGRKNVRERIIRECKGKIDIIVGGPPCQSFSLIGPRSGYGRTMERRGDRRNSLYKEYLKIVEELKPKFIVFENVKGILSKRHSRGRRYIDIIADDFKDLDYAFKNENEEIDTDYLVLNSADHGVPQVRHRVFLIGNNLGILNPCPGKTHFNPESVSSASYSDNGYLKYVTIRDAIGDLPKLKAKFTFNAVPDERKPEIEAINKKRYSGQDRVLFDFERFDLHHNSCDLSGKEFLNFVGPNGYEELTHHQARAQKTDDIKLFRLMEEGMTAKDIFKKKNKKATEMQKLISYSMDTFTDKYRKQSWDRSCTTIFAHLSKDGNRFIHPEGRQARTFTPREAARIQSFPDYYEFCGPRSHKFIQIGNAVPPLLAKAVAEAILNCLHKNKIQSTVLRGG